MSSVATGALAPAVLKEGASAPQVRLTDHVGALALVDDLRHQQNLVDELIDLPRRREEVVKMLRAHYDRQGIPVDDRLIDAGVRAYFDRRLRFEAPQQSSLSAKISQAVIQAYVTRDQWKFHALGAMALIVATTAGVHLYGAHQHAQFEQGKASLLERVKMEAEETVKLDVLLGSRALATDENKAFRLDALKIYLESKRTAFSGAQRAEELDALASDFQRIAQDSDVLKKIAGDLDRLDAEQETLSALAQTSQKTLAAIAAFSVLRENPEFNAALKKYPELLALDMGIQKTIEQSDGEAFLEASLAREVDRLQKRFNGLPVLDRIATRRDTVLKSASQSDARTQTALSAAADGVSQAIAGTDLALAQQKLAWLESVAAYVQSKGTLRIVDRAGVKSGIERTWRTDGRQDKRWYVVAELVSPGGDVLPVPVVSAETGKADFSSLFAVGITQSMYNAIKEDKLSDGRIDKATLGTKDAGQFDIAYSSDAVARAQDNNPGRARMILEW